MKTAEKFQYIIYIDCADREKDSVKLLKNFENKSEEISNKIGKIDIVSSIEQILKENNLKLRDISEFKSNLGPGSFTGLKVGATIANVLNWALGKKKITELGYPNYGKEPNISQPKKL